MSLLNLLEEFVMFEKIRKMKNKKGFTLVELIVVLVILAILAALLIPALTGYIDKAREERLTSEARMVLMAAQTTVSEAYGYGKITSAGAWDTSVNAAAKAAYKDQINQLAELKDLTKQKWSFTLEVVNGSETYKTIKVSSLSYTDGTRKVTYANGQWGSTSSDTYADLTGAFLTSSQAAS